ncbi:MAG: hypothetical protein IT385_23955, partial [Deltaproteobacteria bacterium]|nr:hypothetical protein [Deltaproteobacteria bacterium]
QLEATWTPAGLPTGAKLAPIQARLDKSATTPGFLVQTKADKLTLGYKAGDADVGWFLFGAKHMVPFWDALDVQLRLQNVTSATDPGALVAAPSLVVPDPFTPDPAWQAAWTNEGNAALVAMFDASGAADATAAQKAVVDTIKLTAKRDWVIDMSGKVKWRPKKADLDQRFVAATTDSTDLTVVKVQSAIPYITHEMTQLMFGIDADVRKISNLAIPSIKIDLKDPESLKRIDDFLASSPLNISGNPLQTGLGLLRGAITSLSSTVKGLFGPTLKNLLRTVIKTAFEGLGVGDLLDLSAKAVSAIQSTAQKAIAAVFGPLRDLVDKAVSGLVSGPDEALRELYTTLPGLIADASQTADQAKAAAARAALTTANQVLDTASNALSAANGFLVGMKGKVDLAKSTLQTIKSELASKATTARCLLRNPALPPVMQNAGYTCPANQLGLINILDPSKLDFLSCDKDKNEIIKHIYNIKMKVDAVADQLAGDGNKRLDAMVKVIAAPLGVSSDGFAKTLGVLDGLAKAVKDQVGKAYNKIAGTEPGSLCSKVLGGAGNKLATLADKARTFLDTVRGVLHDAAVKVDGVLGDLLQPCGPFETFKKKLDQVAAVVSNLAGGVKNLKNTVGAYLDPNNLPSLVVSAQQVRDQMDGAAGLASSLMTGQTLKWCADPSCNPGTGSFLGIVADKLAEPVYEVIGVVESKVGAELSKALAVIPFPTKDELLQHITTLIVDSPVLDEITKLVNENLSFIEDKANELVNMVLDQLSVFLQAAFDKVHALLSGVLSAVTAAFEKFPIQAASIKGFADIMGNTLRALQVDAKFTMNKNSSSDKGGDKAANDFGAQLRVESWEANGKGQGCGVTKDAANMYDVSITAMNLPITIGGSDGLKITKLMLGFSIDQGIPIGVFGGINTTGALKVGTFQLRNIAFMAAAGLQEVYIGARAQAIFESFSGEVAFFVGRACTMKPLLELDPGTAKFIAQPNGPNSEFFGAYVHGAFQVPIFSVGCMLKLAIGAEAAIWAFKSGPGFVLGGLVGGSLTGKALCIVSIKGAIRVAVNYSSVDDKVSGSGEFFAAGGFGFSCDEDTWTSIDKVKADDGCGTVSVSASASFAPMSTGPVDTSGID